MQQQHASHHTRCLALAPSSHAASPSPERRCTRGPMTMKHPLQEDESRHRDLDEGIPWPTVPARRSHLPAPHLECDPGMDDEEGRGGRRQGIPARIRQQEMGWIWRRVAWMQRRREPELCGEAVAAWGVGAARATTGVTWGGISLVGSWGGAGTAGPMLGGGCLVASWGGVGNCGGGAGNGDGCTRSLDGCRKVVGSLSGGGGRQPGWPAAGRRLGGER